MKYICFGYLDVNEWGKKSPSEQMSQMDACFAYDEELKKNGNWVWGEALQGPDSAATLRYADRKVTVTDGPYAETKEALTGYYVIDAADLDAAVKIAARIPAAWGGAVELRPVITWV